MVQVYSGWGLWELGVKAKSDCLQWVKQFFNLKKQPFFLFSSTAYMYVYMEAVKTEIGYLLNFVTL